MKAPALFVSAPASGQGKTTVTAAMAAFHRSRGRKVRVFKTGPDFIDPSILEAASGHPVYQLDLWMGGEADCRERLHRAAVDADLILVEGVMGLFDGKPSGADLAKRFGIPVLAVIDAGAMAQTFAAVAYGLANLDENLPFHGVVANRVAGSRHAQMLLELLPEAMKFLGALPSGKEISFPERHLGLFMAGEMQDLSARIDAAARIWGEHADQALPPRVSFESEPSRPPGRMLEGIRIAVAKDAAFCFLYRANLDLLEEMGANLLYFSPLEDEVLPESDSLYLPGGYPELHLRRLAENGGMLESIREHFEMGKPILAECGGMLYCLDALSDLEGRKSQLLGILEGEASMHKGLTALALQEVQFQEGKLRGHTYHHSKMESSRLPVAKAACPNGSPTSEAVYRNGRLTASYIHFYFPSCPQAAGRLFLP